MLAGVTFASNSVGMIHAEQTVDLGGPIELITRPDGSQVIRNRTKLKLRDVTVIAKRPDGRVWRAVSRGGDRSATVVVHGVARRLTTEARSSRRSNEVTIDEHTPTGRNATTDTDTTDVHSCSFLVASSSPCAPRLRGEPHSPGRGQLSQIHDLALDPHALRPGDVRLVALTDTPLPGMSIDPPADQSQSVTIVVAHLRYGWTPPPRADVNSAQSIAIP
jgi:hypothetical protein